LCFTAVSEDATLGFTFSVTLFIVTTIIPGIIGYLIYLKGQCKVCELTK
jgi:hypothetical protein